MHRGSRVHAWLRIAFGIAAVLVLCGCPAPSEPLSLEYTWLDDSSAAATIEDVTGELSSAFVPLGTGNRGYTSHAIWLRVAATNPEPRAIERMVDVCRAWVADVRFYTPAGGGFVEGRSGADVAFHDKPVAHERALQRWVVPAQSRSELYVRLASDGPIALDPHLSTITEFYESDGVEHLWFGAFLAVVGVFALLHVGMYASLRDPDHLLLGGFLLSYALGEAVSHGQLTRVWPATGPRAIELAAFFFGTAGAFFARGTISSLRLPSGPLRRALVAIQWMAVGGALLAFAWPRAHQFVFLLAAAVLCFALVACLRAHPRLGSTARLYALGLLSFVLFTGAAILEIEGLIPLRLWTENVAHIGALSMTFFLSLALANRMLRLHEGALRFVPSPFLEHLGRFDLAQVELGDCTEAQMTVLFSDIRSFTTLSERLTSRQTFDFLNGYLGTVVPRIRSNGGFVDKYIGDAIMALFPKSADDAVRAAVDLHAGADEYGARHGQPVAIGVGLHTGPVMLGTIGEPARMEATVISDAVNLTSRLEGLSKDFGARVIVSAEVVAALRDPSAFLLRRLGSTQVKGRQQPVEIYEVLDAEPAGSRAQRLASCDEFHLSVEALEAGRLGEAHETAERVLARDASDTAARKLLERIEQRRRAAG